MRTDDAKRLPLDQLLARLGFAPVKARKGGRELWYTSPFRTENEASLHISLVSHPRLGPIWVWKDFGDIGGTVIDFALRYYETSDVAAVLQRLIGLGFGSPEAPRPSPALPASPLAPEPERPAHPFSDVRVGPLTDEELLGYLAGRGIAEELAKRYLHEVHYGFGGKAYKALAFGNDQGGYEMRSLGRFKGTLPPKTITLLHPEKLASSQAVTVFEGIIDYLSALTHYGRQEADTPVLILNSVVTEKPAIEKIRSLGARKLHLYLDRDTTGKRIAEGFKEQLPDLEVIDHSGLYAEYKDFNEFLTGRSLVQSAVRGR